MKNLDYAIRVLSLVTAPVDFSIYGPIEDEAYWTKCRTLIAALPPRIHVTYEGIVRPENVVSTLARHQLFLLPTRGENFGHVIHDALSAGLPLLISNQTPWRELEEKGIGWDLPLDGPAAFARRIDEVANWPPERWRQASARAVQLARQTASDAAVLEANRQLFLRAIRLRTEGFLAGG
jgi:glycosyltransferase involved in cell wall biosynthesis